MGMPNIVFRCQMFRGDWDQVWSQMRMLWLMEGLCRVNQTHLRQFDEFKKRGLVENGYPTCYRSGLHYETEKGTEIWPDIPSLLMGTMGKGLYAGAWGDCLPMSTLVLMDNYDFKAIGNLIPGDRIMGDGGVTTVLAQLVTGVKPILAIELDNGSFLRCSPSHRVFLRDGEEKRAESVRVDDLLLTPSNAFPVVDSLSPFDHDDLRVAADVSSSGTATHGPTSEILALQYRILYRMLGQSVHVKRVNTHGCFSTHPIYSATVRGVDGPEHAVRVVAVREEDAKLCCDITTDTGRFYLPESDLIVHNCEDLACYRVAELRELPWHYERQAPWNKTKTESADPRFPQGESERAASAAKRDWPGWKKVKGGVRAKPFAKWRRGPQGNYHYHALTYLPDGRLEDPSLVLGMGREAEFAGEDMARRLKSGEVPVTIQFAKAPEVMVVDPEKPSGYNGGDSVKLDKQVLDLLASKSDLSGSDPEVGAYLSNSVLLGEGEFDVDSAIGWSREEKRFVPRGSRSEARRLLGYARH